MEAIRVDYLANEMIETTYLSALKEFVHLSIHNPKLSEKSTSEQQQIALNLIEKHKSF